MASMTSRQAVLAYKRRNQWQRFTEKELVHTIQCIKELRQVGWASQLTRQVDSAEDLINWLKGNKDKENQGEWLEIWFRLEKLRTLFFEVRFAFDLLKRGVVPTYEKRTLGQSSVDFEIRMPDATFLIELVCTLQTDSLAEETKHFAGSLNAKYVTAVDGDEARKVQSKIVRKVARRIGAGYDEHKFPVPVTGTTTYNVILADTRGFAGGEHMDKGDRGQIVFGAHYYEANGGNPAYVNWVGDQKLAGLFDERKPGPEAKLFRERIHLLGLVSESNFGEDQVIQQTRLYQNPYLYDSKQASTLFDFAGQR